MICNACSRVRTNDQMYRLNLCIECHEEELRQEEREAADIEAFRCKDCGWAVPWDQRMLEPDPEPGQYVCVRCRFAESQRRVFLTNEGVDVGEREEEAYTRWERLERKIVWD